MNPRIYVACLASYNAGNLYGRWIDAQDEGHIEEEIEEMLEASPVEDAEEWAIQDYDDFGGISLGESEDLDRVAAVGALLAEYGDMFAKWYEGADGMHYEPYELEDTFGGACHGVHDDLADYAYDYVDSVGMLDGVNSTVAQYFDFEAFGRDLETGGDVWTAPAPGGKVYVYSSV